MVEKIGNRFGDPYGASLDYGSIPCYTSIDVVIEKDEKIIIRELAKKVRELANLPIEEKKMNLWYDHNALKETRPLIFCDPENGWYEIIKHTDLKCRNNLARLWEFRLRKEIFRGEQLKDDRVIQDIFNCHYIFTYGDYGVKTIRHDSTDGNGAYNWEPAIKDYETDLDKLKIRDISIDYNKTFMLYNLAQDIMGDVLRVRLKSAFWWSYGMTADLINLRGLDTMMMDLYDWPEKLHKVMALLRDDAMHQLDFFEKNDLLTLNNDGTYVGSGGFGWLRNLQGDDFNGHVTCKHMWGHFESQETLGISAEMFEEFVFQYQLPIMKRFAINCYGCCEPLDKRWDVVKKTPNLRRVSVSAWADVAVMAENLGSDYIFSWKPTPSDLATHTIDEEHIRKYIRNTAKITKANNCRVEIIMKDNHTIGNNPQNVIDWVRISREEMGI